MRITITFAPVDAKTFAEQDRAAEAGEIVAELIAVEPAAHVGDRRTLQEGRNPELLDRHVVHEHPHVPLRIRCRVVPLLGADRMNMPAETFGRALEPLERPTRTTRGEV